MRIITLRLVFERSVVLGLGQEPEFRHNLALQALDLKPTNDHYLAIFVFALEPQDTGYCSLRVVSTTVAGIQRYTTTRLRYQGIYIWSRLNKSGLLLETLRAHYRAHEEDTVRRMTSIFGPPLPYWANHFSNGAGDLTDLPEFVIADPELAELEKLFNASDPSGGAENDEGDKEI